MPVRFTKQLAATVCIGIVCCTAAHRARGALLTGSVSGVVSSILETGTGQAPASVDIADPVSVTFSWDTGASPFINTPQESRFGLGLNASLTMTIEGLVWDASDPDGILGIFDNNPDDRFGLSIDTAPGPTLPPFVSFPNRFT